MFYFIMKKKIEEKLKSEQREEKLGNRTKSGTHKSNITQNNKVN